MPEIEKRLILSYIEHNLRRAGDENPFQPFWKFKKAAFPELFRFETTNGRIWGVIKALSNENQYVMKTTNKGVHVDVWNRNVLVKLPEENFKEMLKQ